MTELTRVAVATTDRALIDEQFAEADEFAVYDIGAGGPYFLETRVVEHYGRGEHVIEDRRDVALRALADCQALFAAPMAETPRRKLQDVGIQLVDRYAQEPVDAALTTWWRESNA